MKTMTKQFFDFHRLQLILIWGFIILFIFYPDVAHSGAETGIALFIKTLLPYLLPYIILTQWLLKATTSHTTHASTRFLKAYILGAFGGFPVGAVTITEMVRRGELSTKQASFLLGICHAPGPMFVIGYIGSGLFQSTALGWQLLFAIHFINFIFFLVFILFYNDQQPRTTTNLAVSKNKADAIPLLASLKESIPIISLVATTVIFFSSLGVVLTNVIADTFTIDTGVTETFILALFEMTAGIDSAASHLNHLTAFPYIVAAILACNGLSIHMQVIAIAKAAKLPVRTYIYLRVCSMIFAPVLFYVMQ